MTDVHTDIGEHPPHRRRGDDDDDDDTVLARSRSPPQRRATIAAPGLGTGIVLEAPVPAAPARALRGVPFPSVGFG